MGNDAGNAEFKHWNELAGKFGVTFNEDSKNRVQNDQFTQGGVSTNPSATIAFFKNPRYLFIKEYSSLQLKAPAVSVLKNGTDDVMAVARYGKGTVFALGDPWIYNEYLDGRKLPPIYTNYHAAEDWVQWLLKQVKK